MTDDEALDRAAEFLNEGVLPSIVCPCGETRLLQPGVCQVFCRCGALLANVDWFSTERSEAEA